MPDQESFLLRRNLWREAATFGVVFRGRRFYTGDKPSYVKAAFSLAVEREDAGPRPGEWLTAMMAPLP